MQTFLPGELLATSEGQEADSILRDCVHCGFCNATCPTYQVERNELDGPRGRIYLIKQMLEGEVATDITRHHLDRCLLCQSCETTCPSGVEYHRLLEIGRNTVEQVAPRPAWERAARWLMRHLLSKRQLTVPLFAVARLLRPLTPVALRSKVPERRPAIAVQQQPHARSVILLQGCVQPAMSPTTNQAAARVLDALGIRAVEVAAETCCGALAWHGSGEALGREQARRNIDAWWPLLQAGAEAIVMTASGCGNFVASYPRVLADDPEYAERARVVAGKMKDIAEVLDALPLETLSLPSPPQIAWHCPCTAQHGQPLEAPTRRVLTRLGFALPTVADSHLCCGSAGSYSLFQPAMAGELRQRKLDALLASSPEQIVTANIGCQSHLQGGTDTPVVHWIELVARELGSTLS
ncbi:MAG: glycolate oxidase subunit GlcF [Halieaceae bacterium]|jgi:glycolate oxidase iron-sulfur subunit|nr:glycolate oxidase subunit GlcF [Halieaceae bacterium]